ncbi:XTP/dITP diphosphatase [Geobacter pelophilus]|jgi:XTP/dITP diphosphohydrolase|uniref:dITP/XTP pyrophosphatase n=1 Tax=Geoanaerobacter pelophilus TaxID=60036 RepID=A0AAW4L031_9BACT|nr:XTP/dITP diphosphatase [Geoanaerobacter pelophilus]MBT0662877.1 XTP/dITP diphosphatase [Geoanaerobacter pelophilus]
MKQLLIATSNRGKFCEFSELLSNQVTELFSLADFPQMILPPETGETFEENAIIKASYAARETGIPTIADDSGLEVNYLGGRPGVHSARFAGEAATDQENNKKLLYELANINHEERTARFSCCIAFCSPDGTCATFTGQLAGSIIEQPRGNNGFGYDPLFLVTGYNKTLAELDMSIKNRISHRAEAFRRFTNYLSRCNN